MDWVGHGRALRQSANLQVKERSTSTQLRHPYKLCHRAKMSMSQPPRREPRKTWRCAGEWRPNFYELNDSKMKKTIEPESIVILTYKDPHAAAFNRLNRAWLEEHALLEDGDRKQLEQPRESILAKGGEIFIAVMDNEVIGCCAVIPHEAGVVELAKLAVDARVQGLGIGQRLTETALAWARRRGAQKVILLSSTKLQAALRLYERLGFQYGPLPADRGYQTADIYMELSL
jgi:GNAT superfamily N-acetyltransferase